MILVAAALMCPLVGIDAGPRPIVLHRVETSGLPVQEWESADHADAVCGAAVKLVAIRWKDMRTRGSGLTRCPTCRTWKPPRRPLGGSDCPVSGPDS